MVIDDVDALGMVPDRIETNRGVIFVEDSITALVRCLQLANFIGKSNILSFLSNGKLAEPPIGIVLGVAQLAHTFRE